MSEDLLTAGETGQMTSQSTDQATGDQSQNVLDQPDNAVTAETAEPEQPQSQRDQTDQAEGQTEEAEEQQEQKAADPDADWQKLIDDIKGEEGGEVAASFAGMARENGLAPGQAAKVADWFNGLVEEQKSRMLKEGMEYLKKQWGPKAEERRLRSLAFVSRIDRMTDNAFSSAIRRSGAAHDKDFMIALDAMAGLVAEDPGAGAGKGSHAAGVESELDGIREAFRAASQWKGAAQ